ncbi:MAG: phytoene synthase, partial [Synechococcaceae bacterium WB9_2_112]|nr:phytoene synthase [Synechococcaceae bacterium WB9_2_112]
ELMDSAEAQARPLDELQARLDAWEERTRAMFDGHVVDGLDLVMRDTLDRYPQPLQPYLDMIEGQRMDLRQHRYSTFAELELYCYRVAGTVGLMTQEVMGLDQAYTSAPWSDVPDTSQAAVALGIANQLTNILRDVGEDRGRGRIYLPLEELARFGVSEDQLMAGVVDDNWRALMAFQVQRARDWFARSEAGVRWLAADARWPVWASLRLYRGILDVIEQHGYDVFNRRAFVPMAGKLLDLPRSFVVAQVR